MIIYSVACTWKLPWLELIDVEDRDNAVDDGPLSGELVGEVEGHELIFSREESKPRCHLFHVVVV